jgi:cytochrome P450/NADPH-cytochrome P450 reductase
MSVQTKPAIVPLEEVPVLQGLPVVGNAWSLLKEAGPVQAMMKAVDLHGPLLRVVMPGRSIIMVASEEYVRELCDETRFRKLISTPLRNVQDFSGNGLFTAETNDPEWEKAHRILLPAFGMGAMKGYFEPMLELAEQMLDKWERMPASEEIDVSDDMTRLTLDTIGLCGFDYRFNSFFSDSMHPFVDSMVSALKEAMDRLHRLPFMTELMFGTRRKYNEDVANMNAIVDAVIQERKQHPELASKKDLLSLMLNGRDPVTGEGLSDINIRYQIITFLIAGHETTSGLLSFAMYYLLKHPAVRAKAFEEVDRVLGQDTPTFEKLHELRYLRQILHESLRLWPTAPAFAVTPLEDTTLGGRYNLRAGEKCSILIPCLHRDKEVWGENASIFDPENFAPEKESLRPQHAFKPFGNGQRACIGRQFAMQEAVLALTLLLQRYDLLDSMSYKLEIQETLTLKPKDFRLRLKKRSPRLRPSTPITKTEQVKEETQTIAGHNTPLLVLFGSNMGASEELAERLAREGEQQGYKVTLAPMDEYTGKLPTEGGVLLVTSSYNGHPPDNAVQFCEWLETLEPDSLKGVQYTVFGCGNRDWAATFQSVPRFVDERLQAAGATSLRERGEADASDDHFGDIQKWLKGFWPALNETFEVEADITAQKAPLYTVEVLSSGVEEERERLYNTCSMTILENRELVDMSASFARSKRHLVVELPEGITYQTGDYLGVFADNPAALVERASLRFRLSPETLLTLQQQRSGSSALPTDKPISLRTLLTEYVELQEVVTREQLQQLLPLTPCPPEKRQLQRWTADETAAEQAYKQEVLKPRLSLLQLLERLPSCQLSLAQFLEMLPAMKPRYYSISSSHKVQPRQCTLTVSVLKAPSLSGDGEFQGICSTFLAGVEAGAEIQAFVRQPSLPFHPPKDLSTPLLLIGAGTGIAPFRGFVQERAQSREKPGATALFFGCDHPEVDFLYKEELQEWAEQANLTLYPAFSEGGTEIRFVQHRLQAEAEKVWEMLEAGAMIYLCGDGKAMAPAVRATLVKLYQERKGVSEQEARQWIRTLEKERRYLADVWS